jgi:hypothetical protein
MSCRGSAAGCGRLAMASTAFPRAGAGADGSRHVPKYPTKDPNYRILARQRSRFTHYYFYIRDETLGPMVMRVASSLPLQATVEHRAAAAMQGVTLELAKRDNALALQPVQFDRHSERNSGRLLSIIASPQPSQTASNGSRSPNCGHPAVFAPPTLYELLAASSSNPPTDTTSPFVDGRSRLPCSRNIAASLDKPKPPKLDSRATPLPTSASHAPQQAGSGSGKPIKSRVLGPQRIVILLRCAGCDRVL